MEDSKATIIKIEHLHIYYGERELKLAKNKSDILKSYTDDRSAHSNVEESPQKCLHTSSVPSTPFSLSNLSLSSQLINILSPTLEALNPKDSPIQYTYDNEPSISVTAPLTAPVTVHVPVPVPVPVPVTFIDPISRNNIDIDIGDIVAKQGYRNCESKRKATIYGKIISLQDDGLYKIRHVFFTITHEFVVTNTIYQ